MFSFTTIHGKEFTSYDDYVWDEFEGKFVSAKEMQEMYDAIEEDMREWEEAQMYDYSEDEPEFDSAGFTINDRMEEAEKQNDAAMEDYSFGI